MRSDMEKKLNVIVTDPSKRANLEARFWPKVSVGEVDGCWPWIAKAKHPFGYGRMSAGRTVQLKAHQISWALANGPIPAGCAILHDCDNPTCCNPDHLSLGTQVDNIEDMRTKGRSSKPPVHVGDSHPRAKFTSAQVASIISDTRPAREIAAAYGTTVTSVYRYKKGTGRLAHA